MDARTEDQRSRHSTRADNAPNADFDHYVQSIKTPPLPAPDISGNVESGWAAVTSSIREMDERRIKDVKEDIDNILVFAGLYSAVLSALIAVSIPSLQPDSKVTMVTLLAQITAQTNSYTISPGFLNSTVPPLNVSDVVNSSFEPSLAAKRVNVLWFASLTLALISASFGIMVKQWLSEYLSGQHVSPQTRLRIRHFREPGLEHWHVFGIASLLPVLLQLALALFFVGLCFFTLDIHASIGYTTIPLVAGWALLFIATAFAPSLSPRCPYKFPTLKAVTQLLRFLLFQTYTHVKRLSALPPKSDWIIPSNWSWLSLGYTEQDAATDSRFDAEILTRIDSTQGDDQLLLQMCSAAKETLPSAEAQFNFVVDIIESRLNLKFPTGRFPAGLDLTELPPSTCTILLNTAADVLHRELSRFTSTQLIEWSDWSWNSLMLLFARLPCMLSARATDTVTLCFAATNFLRIDDIFSKIFRYTHEEDKRNALVLYVSERLRPTFGRLSLAEVYEIFYRLYTERFCGRACGWCQSLPECFDTHEAQLPGVVAQHTCQIIANRMLEDVKNGGTWGLRHGDAILFLCKYRREPQEHELERLREHNAELHILVNAMLWRLDIAPHFGRFLYDPMYQNMDCLQVFHITVYQSGDNYIILRNVRDAFRDYINEKILGRVDDAFRSAILTFLSRQISLMQDIQQVQSSYATISIYFPIWHSILNTVHDALQDTSGLQGTHDASIISQVEEILTRIDELDTAWSVRRSGGARVDPDPMDAFEEWATAFGPSIEFFSDEIITDLMGFLPAASAGRASMRARRLDYLRQISTNDRSPDISPATPDAENGHALGTPGVIQPTTSVESTPWPTNLASPSTHDNSGNEELAPPPSSPTATPPPNSVKAKDTAQEEELDQPERDGTMEPEGDAEEGNERRAATY